LSDQSTILSFVWLIIAFLFFFAGATLTPILFKYEKFNQNTINGNKLFQLFIRLFLFTSAVAFLWVGVAIIQFGGVSSLVTLAQSDNLVARDVILAASFPGGRLISSGFIGSSVLAAYLLVKVTNPMRKKIIILIFILSMTYLALIPILLSGRINFFVAAIASFITASYAQQRLIGINYILIGILTLSMVWTAKQYFSLGQTEGALGVSATDQGLEGMLFYFYNCLFFGIYHF